MGYICFWTMPGEIQLLNLAVHPDFRRKGVGRFLLGTLLDQARAGKKTRVYLEVRPSNAAALALYLSQGFRVIGARPDYYPPEGEEAWILEWSD